MHDSGAARDFYSSARALVSEIVRKAGAEMLNLKLMGERGTVRNGMHFVSSHQVGSCKMSSDKSFGVVNDQGEVFDYPGIYITDGSVLSSSLSIGPSLTIAANAERIAEKILTRYVHT